MRLVFVGFPNSVHTARHLDLIADQDWEVHLVPSTADPVLHPELRGVVAHVTAGTDPAEVPPGVRVETIGDQSLGPDAGAGSGTRSMLRARLAQLCDDLDPHLVHTQDIQHAGYLMLEARAEMKRRPPWLVLNCGSDIYYSGRDPHHRRRIQAVLANCDYYVAECHRDVALARAFGFRGRALPPVPIGGGIDVDRVETLREPGPPSGRRAISIKGYPPPIGRPGVIHEALRRCGSDLAGHVVQPYLHYARGGALRRELDRLCNELGLEVRDMTGDGRGVSHDEILAMHGRSRVSIGLNVSDAISQSFLEACAMGSFPVQSNTSCGGELARNGEAALFVDPDDPEAVAAAIRRALTDDALVDRAAVLNGRAARAHLDRKVVRARVIDAYERIAADRSTFVFA